MDRTMLVIVAGLALSVFAVALVAGPGDEGSVSVSIEVSSTGPVEEGVVLSGPSVFYTSEVHEKVKEASEKGKAYDVIRGVEVSYTAGDFIQPGRPLFLPDEPVCTLGFVLGSPGSYVATTAGHCVDDVGEAAVSLQSYPGALTILGEVIEFSTLEANDWALIDINEEHQDNVFPGVLGSPTPQHGAFEVPDTIDGDPAAGSVWPMPVMVVSNNPSLGEDSPVPPLVSAVQTPLMGLLVEEHGGLYLCECPVVPGDSGGPVVVFDPEHPEGAALGLVSRWGERAVDYPWNLPWYVEQLVDPFGFSLADYEEKMRWDRGEHELSELTPMSTVVEAAGLPVATAGPPSLDPPVGEPCVVKEWNRGGNPLMCYSHLFDQW